MKKFLALLGVVGMVAMWSGCGLTNPSGTTNVDITISTIGAVVAGGAAGSVEGTIKADSIITSVAMTVLNSSDADVTTGFTVSFTSGYTGKKSVNLKDDMSTTVAAKTGTAGGTYKLKITASAGSVTSSSTKEFTVTGGSALLAVTASDGKIANVMGPDLGAYDLVNSARVASSGAASSKDLLDLSLAGQGFAGSIGTGNGAKFAAATATDYTGATAASVKTLGDAATASTIAIAANTVFAVKLGNSRGYAIVKILTYDPNAGASTGNNKGEATFEYKFTAN